MDQEQAVARAKEIMARGKPFAMATVDAQCKPWMRWMGALATDPHDDNVHYLVCGQTSRKMTQIAGNPATQLLFSNEDYTCVVTLSGRSEIVADPDTKRMVWEAIPAAARYFSGPDDPGFGVVRFRAELLEVLCLGESHEPVRVDLG